MEIDTHLLSDEQINKINETVAEMLKGNLHKKWWIRPTHGLFEPHHNACSSYVVEPQEDFYERNRPPLKSDFNTKEEAQKWLDDSKANKMKINLVQDQLYHLCVILLIFLCYFPIIGEWCK